MNWEWTIECGPPDEFGIRVVRACWGLGAYSARVRTELAGERARFATEAIRRCQCVLTMDLLAELDTKMIRAMRAANEREFADRGLRMTRLADVKLEKVEWLWPGRIARGAITLLVGDPGLGKSLATLDLAARVSRGGNWPGAENSPSEPGSVVLLNGEDDPEKTIRPRLEAMGADCERIVTLETQLTEIGDVLATRPLALDRDMYKLERSVERLHDCQLVVIDPISAFLGSTGECSNAEVRRLLLPLSNLARRKRLAVVLVSHLRKELGGAVRRTLGSMAFVAASRAVWMIGRDPKAKKRRLMMPVKNNLSSDETGLAFTLKRREAEGVSVVEWLEERVEGSIEELWSGARRESTRARDRELRQAVAWLREFLRRGPQRAKDVREAAEANGYAFGTLRRAFRELGGAARKETGALGSWQWELPGAEARVEAAAEVGGEPSDVGGGEAGVSEAGGKAEEWSGGVAAKSDRRAEGEAEVGSAPSGVGGGELDFEKAGGDVPSGALVGLLPSSEMAEAEERLWAEIRRNNEEVAKFMDRLAAEQREEGRLEVGRM